MVCGGEDIVSTLVIRMTLTTNMFFQ